MPAASSPYRNNDYAAVSNFRPYQLPVNDIFKALTAQNQFWEAGAQRVKSVYDNALDLHLSLAPNQEIRKQYMQEAEKQLTKLSSMDLSDPSIQRQGFNIFKPLFSDEGIMSDDQATRHIEKVNNDALRYRDMNGGKQYGFTNHQYALTGAKEFKTSADRMAGKAYLQQAKDYEPFYDPAGEINNIMKNCKPDKATNSTVQGFYIDTYSAESLSAAKINTCLDAGLSDKAKRQLQINGAVTYQNNPYALRDKYLPYLNGTIAQLSQQKAGMEGVLANKDNLKNLSQDELDKLGIKDVSQITPEYLTALQQNADNVGVRIHNLQDTTSKLASGDWSPISGDNYETVAGTVFSRDYMENVGEGFSYDFNTNTRKADPIQMMFYQQAQLNARNDADNLNQMHIKEMELNADRTKRLTAAGSLRDLLQGNPNAQQLIDESRTQNDTTSPFTTIDKADSYDMVTQKRQDIAKQRGDMNTWRYQQELAFKMSPEIRQGSPEETTWWNNWLASGRGDVVKEAIIQKYYKSMNPLVSLEDLYKGTQDAVDKKLVPAKQALDNDIKNLPSTNINGVIITPDIVASALRGEKTSPLTIIQGNGANPDRYFINGKDIGDIYTPSAHSLRDLVHQVVTKSYSNNEALKVARNDLMQRETVLQREGYTFPELNTYDEKNPNASFKGRIAQNLGMTGKNLMDKITVGQTDLDGRVVITLARPTKSETDYDFETAKQKLLQYGGVGNIEIENKGNSYSVMLVNVPQVDIIDDKDLGSIMKPYVRSLEANTSLKDSKSTPFMRSGNGQSYRLDVSQDPGGGFTYKIIDSEKPTSPVGVYNTRDEALSNFDVYMDLYKQKEIEAKARNAR